MCSPHGTPGVLRLVWLHCRLAAAGLGFPSRWFAGNLGIEGSGHVRSVLWTSSPLQRDAISFSLGSDIFGLK